MSEMAHPRDEFHEDMFGESIDDAAVRALNRLRRLRNDEQGLNEMGDVQYERYIGKYAGYAQTRIYTFTSVFDSLHAVIMRADIMSDYLHSIVGRLVANGVKAQSTSAGNLVTQLPPDRDALNSHATRVWSAHAQERNQGQSFGMYRFYVGGDIAEVIFSPDTGGETWSLGYETRTERVLAAFDQTVGAAWLPAQAS